MRDQIGQVVQLTALPGRIVSLVPSQTELLADLGLEDEVIGITKFCVHPEKWFRSKTRIGGTKTVNIELIRSLQPDLILANKEENIKEQAEALRVIAPVWTSDVNCVEEALSMIESIGILTGKRLAAFSMAADIRIQLASLQVFAKQFKPVKVAYLIWKDPYMTVGGDTFIHDMLATAGWENVFAGSTRYPEVSIQEIADRGTELLLLSSEPYPFGEKHIHQLQQELPDTEIRLVDGEMFSWYGSHLLQSAPYIKQLLRHR